MKAAAMVALLGACSFGMPDAVRGPVHVEPTCSANRARPVLDTIGAVFFGAIAIPLFIDGNDSEDDRHDRALNLFGGMTALTGAILAYAAYSGYGTARECRQIKSEWELAVSQPQPQPGAPGTERSTCRVAQTAPCDPGLACASGYCVRPP